MLFFIHFNNEPTDNYLPNIQSILNPTISMLFTLNIGFNRRKASFYLVTLTIMNSQLGFRASLIHCAHMFSDKVIPS